MNSSSASLTPSRPETARRASATRALTGTIQYQFLMQLRRKALWIAFAILGLVLLTIVLSPFVYEVRVGSDAGPSEVVYTRLDVLVLWSIGCQFMLLVGAGLLLSDRTPRDRHVKTAELLRATPAPSWVYLLGTYLGAVSATLLPILAIYAIGVARLALAWHDLSILPAALATFGALVVPPLIFVGAFSIACTTLVWAPLYQFLFIGYWLWANLNPGQAIPTLNATLLSPAESYVVTGFFHFSSCLFACNSSAGKSLYPASSMWLGFANIAVLLTCAALVLLAANAYQTRRADHE